MLQVFHNANFRLMWGTKWFFMVFSLASVLVAAGAMIVKGFNYGIDFAGGTSVQVRFRETPPIDVIRKALESAGLGDVTIQQIGDPADHEVLIRVEQEASSAPGGGEGGDVSHKVILALRGIETHPTAEDRIDLNTITQDDLRDWIAAHLPSPAGESIEAPAPDAAAIAHAIITTRNGHGGLFTDPSQVAAVEGVSPALAAVLKDQSVLGDFALRGVDFVGPTAGKELKKSTELAILGAVVGILAYVWFRFHRIAWGVTSIIAVVHDVTIAAGALALTGKEFSLTVVAALLTILGYSINDTIVVFDRIRENMRLYRDKDFELVVNASVNQTLSRTVLTSFTVFVAVTALFLYGGEKLNPMSFCLMVGVIFGTYSSIFVAAALLVVVYRILGPKYVKA